MIIQVWVLTLCICTIVGLICQDEQKIQAYIVSVDARDIRKERAIIHMPRKCLELLNPRNGIKQHVSWISVTTMVET